MKNAVWNFPVLTLCARMLQEAGYGYMFFEDLAGAKGENGK